MFHNKLKKKKKRLGYPLLNYYQIFFFVSWRSKGRGAMPQGHENGGEKNRKKRKKTTGEKTRENYRVKDRQNGRGPLHTEPARQLRQGIEPRLPSN